MILKVFRKGNVVGELYVDDDTERLVMRTPRTMPKDIVVRVFHAFTKQSQMFSRFPLVGSDGQMYEWELAGWKSDLKKKEDKPKKRMAVCV